MPKVTNIKLVFKTKRYPLFNQTMMVWQVTSPIDKTFKLQLRFLQENIKKIDLSILENYLKKNITAIQGTKNSKLLLDYVHFSTFLKNEFGSTLKFPEFILNKTLHKILSNNSVQKERDLTFYSLSSANIGDNNAIRFGYEMPTEDSSINSVPICCARFFIGKIPTKKIYLFPISSEFLENTRSAITEAISTLNNLNLRIPFVIYDPTKNDSAYDKEIQIRIALQTDIADILTHLKKPKCFRSDGEKKYKIFSELAKRIAKGDELENIKATLDSHDTWKTLAQHRDPWGFFAFFKGQTHSLITWNLLKQTLKDVEPTTTPLLSNT